MIKDRPKYGITLTQRRLHRILYYLVTSKPVLTSLSSEGTAAEPNSADIYTTALSLLPIYQLASAIQQSPALTDPFVTLSLLNLALSLPLTPEQTAHVQEAIDELTGPLVREESGASEVVKNRYGAGDRSRLMMMMTALTSKLDKLTAEGISLSLPPSLPSNLEKLTAVTT